MASVSLTVLVREAPIAAPSAGVEVATSVSRVLANVRSAVKARKSEFGGFSPRLVAVTKKHPVEKVVWAYNQGLRHFGESYVQELHSKASHIQNNGGYLDIKWHFIGHLQHRNIKLLTSVPGLWMVETLHSIKVARTLDRLWSYRENGNPLRVLVQVNTSKESSKHGVPSDECMALVHYVKEDCAHLSFDGLMTIGRMNHHPDISGPNPDYVSLVECGKKVQSDLQLPSRIELSMGMSADYEHAVELGSTSVRIGTALFGERPD